MNEQTPSTWQTVRARVWYAWGSSLCYWGIQTAEAWFYRAGVRAFDRAVQAWPQFARGFYRRGLVRARELGQPREGIADLTRASELEPEWAAPYLQRGLIECFHGDPLRALADLRRYLELGGDAQWRAEAERQIAALEELGNEGIEERRN